MTKMTKTTDTTLRPSRLTRGLFTSTTDLWATPQAFFDALDAEFEARAAANLEADDFDDYEEPEFEDAFDEREIDVEE